MKGINDLYYYNKPFRDFKKTKDIIEEWHVSPLNSSEDSLLTLL